jgi:hypothetical protein
VFDGGSGTVTVAVTVRRLGAWVQVGGPGDASGLRVGPARELTVMIRTESSSRARSPSHRVTNRQPGARLRDVIESRVSRRSRRAGSPGFLFRLGVVRVVGIHEGLFHSCCWRCTLH